MSLVSRLFCLTAFLGASAPSIASEPSIAFPLPLEQYTGEEGLSLFQVLVKRAREEPLNLVAASLFALAVLHTFLAARITHLAHLLRARDGRSSFRAEVAHLFGEVEAVFGIWVVPLLAILTLARGWSVAESFMVHVHFTEAMFVVVIMAIASTRPVLSFAESVMGVIAGLGRRSPFAWWCSILTVGPLLGSFITEPAAMTICALLLAGQFYRLAPPRRLAYATLGLLFVNVSVGGTLTHFAAPPVLIVAAKYGWDSSFMLAHFGWKAVLGILVATGLYALLFRSEFRALAAIVKDRADEADAGTPVPIPVTMVHLCALAWTVFTAHTPVLFVGGFLFFLAFTQATASHQSEMNLRAPLLVGFFLAGLVVHGSLQGWWIAPVLERLTEIPLFFGAMGLTALNDNAAITYLASLVPGFTEELKYAVVAGAVAGGGLTVIANAPNPAGQAILARFFPDGVSALFLVLAAIVPTLIVGACFLFLG